MNLETVSALPGLVNRALGSAGLAAALVFTGVNYDAVERAFRETLTHVASIHEVKINGVDVTFDSDALDREAANFPIEKFAGAKIAAQINQLDPRSLVRLLQVGTLKDLCVFSRPTAEMDEMVGVDHRLEELGLVARYFSDDQTSFVTARMQEYEKRDKKPASIGAPLRCYELTLTAEGLDVRTVIAHMLGSAFAHNAPTNVTPASTAPAPGAPSSLSPAPSSAAPHPASSKAAAPTKFIATRN